jgi:hypothetical protein
MAVAYAQHIVRKRLVACAAGGKGRPRPLEPRSDVVTQHNARCTCLWADMSRSQ